MSYAIVELHDVSPFHKEEVYSALEFLEKVGIDRFSILLIPNFRGEYPINRHASFVSFIERTQQEIILHGYTHTGKRRLKEILYTYGEGEFGEGTIEDTYKRIEKAMGLAEAMRLDMRVFVAPAWIGNPWLDDLLYSFGFLGVGYRGRIKNLQNGEDTASPVLTFSNRHLLSYLSIKAMPLLFTFFKHHPVLRLALHTADFRDRRKLALWRLILSQIKKERRLTSYGELLSKSRPSSPLQGVQPARGLV